MIASNCLAQKRFRGSTPVPIKIQTHPTGNTPNGYWDRAPLVVVLFHLLHLFPERHEVAAQCFLCFRRQPRCAFSTAEDTLSVNRPHHHTPLCFHVRFAIRDIAFHLIQIYLTPCIARLPTRVLSVHMNVHDMLCNQLWGVRVISRTNLRMEPLAPALTCLIS